MQLESALDYLRNGYKVQSEYWEDKYLFMLYNRFFISDSNGQTEIGFLFYDEITGDWRVYNHV